MNTPFQFVPSLTTVPYNHGMAETFSWVGFDDASVPRPFYARACYVTNLSDLTVSLCAADIRIGGVEIVDNDSSLRCDVTSFSYEDGSYNALRVVNQDLDPELDTVSLADKNSNNVTVYAQTSSLNVHVTNFSPLTSLVEKEFNETQTLLNELTSLQNNKQNRIITLLDQLTANTDEVENLIENTNTKIDVLTAVDYATFTEQNVQTTLLNVLTAKDYATSLNQNAIITLLNALTANEQEFNLNTDNIEELLTATNTFLSVLTAKDYATSVKQDTQITLLDVLTGVSTTITANQYTALTTANTFYTACITELDSLTASANNITVNQKTLNSMVALLTGVNYSTASNQEKTITLLDALTAREYEFTVSAQEINLNTDNIEELLTATNTFLDILTSKDYSTSLKQDNQITLLNVLTANSIYGTVSAQPLHITGSLSAVVLKPVTAVNINNDVQVHASSTFPISGSVTVINPISAVTILNQITGIAVTNDVQVHAVTTLPVSGSVTVINQITGINVLNSIALKDLNGNNVTVVSSTSSLNVNVTNPVAVVVDPSVGFPVTFANSANLDAFGRLRVSTPLTLFDSSHRYRDNNLWSTLTAVNGTVSFAQNQGLIELTVNNLSGSSVIRETTKVFAYQPGKSLLIMNTFVMAPSAHNLRQRVGYFGADNGIYFQLDDEKISLVERSLVNGSPSIETIIPLSAWNGDRLDGNGPSKLTLDLTKAQIQWMDVEWLGVGTVRTGLVINGQFITCHSFHHANLIPSTYITTASLPLRYEITNKDSTVGSHTLKQICSTVISEGGYELRGLQQAISIPITSPRTFAATNTYYPIISIRLKTSPDRLDAIVILTALSILGVGNGINYNWQVKASGDTSGGSWVNAGTDSAVEYNISGTSYTGGRILASGFLNASNQASPNLDILKEALFKFQLERNNLTKTPYEITLVAATDTSNGSGIFASMDWEEISR